MTSVQSVGPNVQQPMQMQPGFAQPQYYPEVLDVKEYPDHFVYTIKDDASTGKKWGVGLGSFFLPGLGQAINGQWLKAAGFFGGSLVAGNVLTKYNPILGGLTTLGICIWSTVDAVKNASSKSKQVVPKENINAQG